MKPNESTDYIFTADEGSFEALVIERSHEIPVLVDFWADWCSPCRLLNPVLKQVVGDSKGNIVMASIDTDENMKLAGRYKLTGFPSVLLFINGKECGRFTGARNLRFVSEFIRNTVADATKGE